ncbi:hypothetical protein F5Y13DRAFT_203068 [Hypoxylon sp. FL1857]|nr:hypothetical protein F5Y13DRAFT_203068 [Hypoxylon sp. FL1857]
MAEAVGLASAVVGFTSLAIQLGSGATRLRTMYQQSKESRHTIRSMVEDLEFISQFLPELSKLAENTPIESPLIVGHCIQRSQALHEKIERLEGKFADASNNGQLSKKAKNLLNYHRLHHDIEDLRNAILSTKTDLCMALTFTQGVQHRQSIGVPLPPVDPQEERDSSPTEDESRTRSSEDTVLSTKDRALRQKISSCQIKHCSCSCHIRGSVARRFWNLEYTPLSMILQRCDNARCTSRRHRISFRVAFTQMGLPWAVTLGLEMAVEAGRYSIGPTLETERIVRYTSPGFKLLWELRTDQISRADAIHGFRELWKTDPHMIYHVNPAGRGYIEELVSAHTIGPLFGDCRDLLELFTQEFNMRLGLDSLKILYKSASWIGEGPHLSLLDTLLAVGLDPMDLPSPHWKQWPTPCSPDWRAAEEAPDPFFLEYISTLVAKAPDFGTSSVLQTAILAGDRSTVTHLIKNSNHLERENNFLGQSALHIGILNDWAVEPLLDAGHDPDVRDFHGITPLMYAAGMGKLQLVKLLLNHNAHPLLQDNLWHRDFIGYAMARGHWNIVTEAIAHIETIYQDVQGGKKLVSYLAELALASLIAIRGGLHDQSTNCFVDLLPMVDTVNFRFSIHGEGRDSTLLHHISNIDEARALLSHDFTLFNAEDSNGNTPIMNKGMRGKPEWIRMLLDVGADPNHQNNKGESVLSQLFEMLRGLCHSSVAKDVAKVRESITMLFKAGAKVLARDQCNCPCSPNGCLPTRFLAVRFKRHMYLGTESPLWTFELLRLLEECSLAEEAKQTILAFIRRSKFDELEMAHTCCTQGCLSFDRYFLFGLSRNATPDRQRRAMELNAEKLAIINEYMDHIRDRTCEDLKLVWLQQIKLAYDSSVGVQKPQKNNKPRSYKGPQFLIDTKRDEFTYLSNLDIDGEWGWEVERSIALHLLELESWFLSVAKQVTDQCELRVWHRRRLNWVFQLMSVMEIHTDHIIGEIGRMNERYGPETMLLTTPEQNDFVKRFRAWAAEYDRTLK